MKRQQQAFSLETVFVLQFCSAQECGGKAEEKEEARRRTVEKHNPFTAPKRAAKEKFDDFFFGKMSKKTVFH